MNKGVKFLFCGILILISLFMGILLIENFSIIETNGNAIWNLTGKSTTQVTDVSVYILPLSAPTLTITSPQNNKTYIINQSIPLTYQVSGEQAVWYNIDSGTNITISDSIFFNISEGSHTIYLYANNSMGTIISQNVSFLVNSTRFQIIYYNYSGITKGNSTNFSNYSYENIQNFSNLILENINYGKILFNQNVNLTDTQNPSDNLINLDLYTNISSNRIELNSTALPNLNKPSTIWLYGLTFSNPEILKDGIVCPDSICTKESYINNILKFNVTGFSIYSADEGPTAKPPAGQSGGGGGGGITTTIITESFTVNKNELKIGITKGSIITESIIVTNTLKSKISINLKERGLDQFLILNSSNIELGPKESKKISFDIIAREDVIPNLYLGKIILNEDGGLTQKEVFLVIEVESKGALFDTTVTIPDLYSNVYPGQEILAEVKLYNLGLIKRADVSLEYTIKNEETGETLSTQNETIAVETQASTIKEIRIPKDAKIGRYILYVKTTYDEKVSSSSAEFNIIHPFGEQVYILGILILAVMLTIIFYLIKRRQSPIRRHNLDKLIRK
ncbi:Nucleoporin autopeptidase [uncultured archaeon]|nr:Nucleoporin autopeptidase [uncultured archaeon]